MLCFVQGVYAHLYQQREEQVAGSPSSSSKEEGKLQLKLLYYTCSNVPYLAGKHITCKVMEHANFTGKQILEGWAHYNLAYTTLRNLYKASEHAVRKSIK
jgi:hypothetical protein